MTKCVHKTTKQDRKHKKEESGHNSRLDGEIKYPETETERDQVPRNPEQWLYPPLARVVLQRVLIGKSTFSDDDFYVANQLFKPQSILFSLTDVRQDVLQLW